MVDLRGTTGLALWLSCQPLWTSAVAVAAQAPGGSPAIEVLFDRAVDIGAEDLAAVEPHVSSDPDDARHLVAGVFLVERLGDPRQTGSQGVLTCAALTTFDGGASWTRHDFAKPRCLDPWVAILPDGSAVFQGLSAGELFQFRSTDGGATWSDEALSFGTGFDHGTLAVDRAELGDAGSLYSVAHRGTYTSGAPPRGVIFLARSADGGRTYEEPTELMPSNLIAFPMNPVVTTTGAVVVPVVNFSRLSPAGGTELMDRPPTWVVVSEDRARSFSSQRFVTDLCARGFSMMATGHVPGTNEDVLYIVCHDRNFENVFSYASRDLGETWSGPARLNAGAGSEPYVQNVALAVDQSGILAVSWYDARNDPRGYRGTFRCQQVFLTASLDGGQTFLPEVPVSSDENCPDTPQNGEAGRRWVAGGDYHGLTAIGDGTFQVLWADSRTGRYQLRTAVVRVTR